MRHTAHYGQFHFYFSLTDSQAYIPLLNVVGGVYMGGAEDAFYISCQVKVDSTTLAPPFVFHPAASFPYKWILFFVILLLAWSDFVFETEMGNTRL